MYICLCNAVTDQDIREAVNDGVCTFSELQDCLAVSTCCGKCTPYAQEVLQEALSQYVPRSDFQSAETPILSLLSRFSPC